MEFFCDKKMTLNEKLCNYIRLRLAEETLTDAAKQIGVSKSYLCALVNDGRNFNLNVKKLERFARYFHVSVPDLILLAEAHAGERMIRADFGDIPEDLFTAFVIMVFNVRGKYLPMKGRLTKLRKTVAAILKNSPPLMNHLPEWIFNEPEFSDAAKVTDKREGEDRKTVE